MADARTLPAWAEDLRRRYLRNEAVLFILHGNVHDLVLVDGTLKPLTEFLTEVFWKDMRDTIAVYNLAIGVKFVKKAKKAKEAEAQEELMREAPREKALAGLERLLVTSRKVGVVVEYAETIAPAGDGSARAASGVYMNDLWRWDGANWTWMGGAETPNGGGVYGVAGTPSVANTPGARDTAFAWKDVDGKLWLMDGFGVDSAVIVGRLADLWSWEVPGCAPPSAEITAPDSILEGSGPRAASVVDTGAGATYEWTISGGTIDSGQGTPAISFSALTGETNVKLGVVVRSGDCAASGEKSIPVGVYFRLDIVRLGDGADTVRSASSGISCGLDCAAVFAQGSSVALSAHPGPGSRFLGWQGGGCFGTGGCAVTMDQAKTVSATFIRQAAASFYPVAPCRIADTRNSEGHYGAPALEAGETRAFAVGGTCGVPIDATAVALNVTVTGPTSAGSLTLLPGATPVPETSVVSFAPGRTRASNVTMALAGGVLSVLDRQDTGTVDLILDVSGYYR